MLYLLDVVLASELGAAVRQSVVHPGVISTRAGSTV